MSKTLVLSPAVDVEMGDMEDELSAWMERELSKVYDIINDNPLGK